MEEVTTYPWLAIRGRTFYLRAPVPQDIQKTFGKVEIWKSLRTQDRKAALDRLRKESAVVTSIFDEHRSELARLATPPLEELTEAQLKAVGDAYFVHLLEEDDGLREDGFEGEDFDAHADDIDALDEVNRQEFARGLQSEFMRDEAREVLSWTNVNLRLAEGSPSWPKLLRAIYAARIKADAAKKQRNAGEVIETPAPLPISPKNPSTPKVSLEDAKDFYVAEKVSGDVFTRKRAIQRIDRLMVDIKAALKEIPALTDWTPDDAYKVRDYMLAKGTLKPASVRRELNTVKGIFSTYQTKRLRSLDNPFSRLDLPASAIVDKDARDPLPEKVTEAIRELIFDKSNPDIRLIWRLLEGTGCRVAEIAGLRVQDVVVDADLPHLKIVGHPGRRLKTASSERDVPLVADALEAAREALKAAKGHQALFARYSNGAKAANTVSQLLMKYVRKVTDNPKYTAHSLRHSMSDRLNLAGVSANERNAILGHMNAGVGEQTYGSRQAKLQMITAAMRKAHGVAEAAR